MDVLHFSNNGSVVGKPKVVLNHTLSKILCLYF